MVDGNFTSRVALIERLDVDAEPPTGLAGLFRDVSNMAGISAWDTRMERLKAFRARILAELVTLYHDNTYRDAALEALGSWNDGLSYEDATGHILMDIHAGDFEQAKTAWAN